MNTFIIKNFFSKILPKKKQTNNKSILYIKSENKNWVLKQISLEYKFFFDKIFDYITFDEKFFFDDYSINNFLIFEQSSYVSSSNILYSNPSISIFK